MFADVVFGGFLIADWFFYGILLILGVGLLSIVLWFYNSRLKVGHKACFSVKLNANDKGEGGVRKIVGYKEIKLGDSTVSFRKKEFMVDWTKPSIQRFSWTYYDFDFNNGNQITYGGEFRGLNPVDADEFMSDALVRKMMRELEEKKGEILMLVVVAVMVGVMGFMVGLFGSPYILPPRNGTVTFTRLVLMLGGMF